MVKFNYLLHQLFQTPRNILNCSGLNVPLIKQICKHETAKLMNNKTQTYILQSPFSYNEVSNLRILDFSFEGIQDNITEYGTLVFRSNPMRRFRNQNIIKKYSHFIFSENVLSRSTLKTFMALTAELFKNKTFQVGFQNFENSSIIFYPHNWRKFYRE